jgi:hypothetical protein
METCGSIALPFLISALDGGEWSALRPGLYTAGTYWLGGRVDLRAALDAVKERKFCTAGNRTRAVQLVAKGELVCRLLARRLVITGKSILRKVYKDGHRTETAQ